MSSNFDESIEIIETMKTFILTTLKKLLKQIKKPWLEQGVISRELDVVALLHSSALMSLRDVREVLISFFLRRL